MTTSSASSTNESALDAASSVSVGSIHALYTCSEAGAPMQSVPQATLIEGVGMQGDRYATQQGTYSVLSEPGRQLTLMSRKIAPLLLANNNNNESSDDFVLATLRRNVVIDGLAALDLVQAIGHVVELGDTCQLLVHRNCVPCRYNDRKNKFRTGALLESNLWFQMGVNCQVLQGGRVQVGDGVRIRRDLPVRPVQHDHLPSFFLPPAERSAAMVREALDQKRKLHRRLKDQDPEGVERVEASYQSVGLSFWPSSSSSKDS